MRYRCTRTAQVRLKRPLGTFTRCAEWNGKYRGENRDDLGALEGASPTKELKMKRQFKGLSVSPADEGAFEGADAGELGDALFGSSEMRPVWGAIGGATLASVGILIAKSRRAKSPKTAKYAGLVGLATAGIPSALALLSPKYRRAAYLGLATATIVSVGELIRAMYVEPQFGDDEYGEYEVDDGMGMYQPEMTDGYGAVEILGDGGMGAGIEVLGQASPQEAMGLYQPEMTGAAPLDVAGGGLASNPYSGSFMGVLG